MKQLTTQNILDLEVLAEKYARLGKSSIAILSKKTEATVLVGDINQPIYQLAGELANMTTNLELDLP